MKPIAEVTIRHETRKRAVWLQISSWRGISFGAVHYYGTLKIDHECTRFPCGCESKGIFHSVDLKRTLTASEARDLTKLQNDNSLLGLKHRYHEGDETKCFDTKDEIVKLALDTYRDIYPEKTLLILGDIISVTGMVLDDQLKPR